jgi:hypothetical protein
VVIVRARRRAHSHLQLGIVVAAETRRAIGVTI